jgi:hypothetical protein
MVKEILSHFYKSLTSRIYTVEEKYYHKYGYKPNARAHSDDNACHVLIDCSQLHLRVLDDAAVDLDRHGRRPMGRPPAGAVQPRRGPPRRLQRPSLPRRLQVLGRRVRGGSPSLAVWRPHGAHLRPGRRQGGHLRPERRVLGQILPRRGRGAQEQVVGRRQGRLARHHGRRVRRRAPKPRHRRRGPPALLHHHPQGDHR